MKLKISFLLMFFSFFAFGQKMGQVNTPDTEEFPKIKFNLHLYKPDAKDGNDFELIEDGKKIQDIDVTRSETPIPDKKKHILILFEDMTHSSHALQKEYFQYVLENSMPDFVKQGDKINIAAFDRNRGKETSLRFLLNEYTDDVVKLVDAVKNFESINDRHSRNKSSELYDAVNDGLEELHTKFSNKNCFILELSAGFNLSANNNLTQESLIGTAREYRIPIYSVYYNIYDNRTTNDYAEKSFGLFHLSSPKRNDKDATTEKVKEFMNGALKRHYGYTYSFEFNSEKIPDGKLHTYTVKVDGQSISKDIQFPSCGIVCFFVYKPYIAIPVVVVLISLMVWLILFLKKKKEKEKAEQERKEAEQAEKLKQIEVQRQKDKEEQLKAEEQRKKEAEEAERKRIEEQKRFQQKVEEEKRAEEMRKKRIEEEKKEAEKMQILLQEMQNNRGGLPSLKVVSHNLDKVFTINKPVINFGREKSINDFFMAEPTVSGQHFQIYYNGGEYFIKDMNSTNGTKINGTKIGVHKLRHNDIIQAGKAQMMFIW